MKNRLRPGLLTALLLLMCSTSNAQTFVQGQRIAPNRGFYQPQPGAVLWRSSWRGPPPPYTHPEYYRYLNERYPKFYGAFHSNYFHNMGLPPGDIGIRGNGIYPTPW